MWVAQVWDVSASGLSCTRLADFLTTSQTNPPSRLHLLGANWRPWHFKKNLSVSQNVGSTSLGRQCIWAELHETNELSDNVPDRPSVKVAPAGCQLATMAP